DRLAEAGIELGLVEALDVRAQVEEVEGIGGTAILGFLDERARVGKPADASAGGHREVMTALAAGVERRGELVVAVVRPAAGAGVRVLLAGPPRLHLLDRDIDPGLGHA